MFKCQFSIVSYEFLSAKSLMVTFNMENIDVKIVKHQLKDLELERCGAKFDPALSVRSPGEGLRVRPLCLEDYDRGFLQLLAQLTTVGDISR